MEPNVIIQINPNETEPDGTYTIAADGTRVSAQQFGEDLSVNLNAVIRDMKKGQYLSLFYRVSDTIERAQEELHGAN